MNTTHNNQDRCRQTQGGMQPRAHFYIYEDLTLICNRVFNKHRITIGSSQKADLYLDHHTVADIHALVDFKEDQVFLTNKFPQNGLRLNGRAVGLAELQHEDVIDIGPYSLKIKITPTQVVSHQDEESNYAVRLVNRYSSQKSMQVAAGQLAKILRTTSERVLPLLAKENHILKRGLTAFKAAQVQNALLKEGVVCDVHLEKPNASKPVEPSKSQINTASVPPQSSEPEVNRSFVRETFRPISLEQTAKQAKPKPKRKPKPAIHTAPEPTIHTTPKPVSQKAIRPVIKAKPEPAVDRALVPAPVTQKPVRKMPSFEEMAEFERSDFSFAPADEDDIIEELEALPAIEVSFTELFEDEIDEDEEEVWEAPFSLKSRLEGSRNQQRAGGPYHGPEQLQVVKTIGRSVVDVSILSGRQKYDIDTDQGRIRLVDLKPKGDSYVSILPEFSGFVKSPSGVTTADLDSYKTTDYLKSRKKSLYRIPMPQQGTLVVEADGSNYQISSVPMHPTPEVSIVEQPSEFNWRHWASSAGVHVFLVLCLSIYSFLQTPPPKVEDPHFVQVDPSMLEKTEVPEVKPKPKEPPPPPPKPEPVKVAEKVTPPKKKPVKQKKRPVQTAKRRNTNKKVASTGGSRHPQAGGGFGKGNIKNRNINQTGILSVLGSSSIGGPSQAIASVTNLDAVPVPGATGRNFSVGGVKGALGNGKISVASGGAIMQTKGSKQVLRSAGASGKGQVAALERGSTGKKKVQAMVSAKMSRTVKIEGGMSRAMVKQVIDQHLAEITYCYETALMSNPSILGRIVFEWKIRMDGRVGEIKIVASNVNSHEIHNCIKSAIRSWQFPKPSGAEVVVSYPFVFDLVAF